MWTTVIVDEICWGAPLAFRPDLDVILQKYSYRKLCTNRTLRCLQTSDEVLMNIKLVECDVWGQQVLRIGGNWGGGGLHQTEIEMTAAKKGTA